MPLPQSTIAFLSTTFFVVIFFFCFSLFWEKKFVPLPPPIFSAPSYATALQSCKRRLTVSCHPLYTCIHIYEWKTSDLHRRSYEKKYFGKSKRNPQSYIILLECTFASIFPQNVSGKPPPLPNPTYVNSRTHPYRRFALRLVYTPAVNGGLVSGSLTDNAIFFSFFFFAILLRFEWVTKYGGWFVSFRFVAAK